MIAKSKSIQHGGAAINYALTKDNAEVISKHMIVGETGAEIKQEFKVFQDLNHRTINKDLSFVISPTIKDGTTLTNKEYRELSDSFLKKMNLDQHQSIVIKHNDKAHKHLHIFVNRINQDGKAYTDSFISKKSQDKIQEVAKELQLQNARTLSQERKQNLKHLRLDIYEKHKDVLKERPKDFNAYIEAMQQKGVEIQPTINKQGKLQGHRILYKGENLKASEVNKNMTLNKMMGKPLAQLTNTINPTLKLIKTISKVIEYGIGF